MDLRDTTHSNTALVVVTLIAVLLHVGIGPQISIFGGRINFMLVLAILYAFSGNARSAVIAGFACGLFYDLTASVPVGLMTLLLTIGGFVLSNTPSASVGSSLADASRLSFVYAFAICIVYSLLLLIMGVRSDVMATVFGHGFTSAIITGLVTIPALMFSGVLDGQHRSFSSRGKGSRFKGIK